VISETKTGEWILLSLSSCLEQNLVPQGSFENLQILRGQHTKVVFFFGREILFQTKRLKN
jgi:hypothetical protein